MAEETGKKLKYVDISGENSVEKSINESDAVYCFGSDTERYCLLWDGGNTPFSTIDFTPSEEEKKKEAEYPDFTRGREWSFTSNPYTHATAEKAQKQADPKGAGKAIGRCCPQFLEIVITRHTAVLLKNAADMESPHGTGENYFLPIVPNFVAPEAGDAQQREALKKSYSAAVRDLLKAAEVQVKNKAGQTLIRHDLSKPGLADMKAKLRELRRNAVREMFENEQKDIEFLANLDWRGIVGTMEAAIIDTNCQGGANGDPTVSGYRIEYISETYEPKGPPQIKNPAAGKNKSKAHAKDENRNKCLAVPEGKYRVQTIDGKMHKTYGNFDKTGTKRPYRGVRISNEDVPFERGIDIHVGANAGYTEGCIMLAAPEIVYQHIQNKGKENKQQDMLKAYKTSDEYIEYAKTHSWPDIKDAKWPDFDGGNAMPSWVQRVSLIKVTKLIELMEDTLKFRRDGLPKGDLNCISLEIKNPLFGLFDKKHIIVLETPNGPPAEHNIESIELIKDVPNSYKANVNGQTYLITSYPHLSGIHKYGTNKDTILTK